MASKNTIIKNYDLDNISKITYSWINNGDNRYQFLQNELINKIFPLLRSEDKDLLLEGLVKIINFINIKFGFWNNNDKNENLLWEQLVQNNLMDLRALILAMLPFVDDNEKDDKKRSLKKLNDLYLERDARGMFIYTNSQYNRCIRHNVNDKTVVFFRPYLKEYFIQHLELLIMSIETISNKLYINWVDILPIRMDIYMNTKLYRDTINKFNINLPERNNINMINYYIDPTPGISYQDFYNVISNHLYHEIKNHKWLIYDIMINNKPIPYIKYIETKFNLDNVWNGLLWSQLTKNEVNMFTNQWKNFLDSMNINDNTVLQHFYFFFTKYHKILIFR